MTHADIERMAKEAEVLAQHDWLVSGAPLIEFAKLLREQTLQAVVDQGELQYSPNGPYCMDDFVMTLVDWCKTWIATGEPPKEDE